MYAAFPRSEYYQRIRLPLQRLPFSGMIHIVRHTPPTEGAGRDHSGSLRFLDTSFSERAVPTTPPQSPATLAICGAPTFAFQPLLRCRPAGSYLHEAPSLHFRYGPLVALSTLSSYRYLNEPKTRFPVRRLHLLSGQEFHPLEASGLS
jgi:hypothetical protein